jgi:hypothetical protein
MVSTLLCSSRRLFGTLRSLCLQKNSCLPYIHPINSRNILADGPFKRFASVSGSSEAAHPSHSNGEFVHEPTGRLFGLGESGKLKMDSAQKIFLVFYLGGLFAMMILHCYKPDDDPRSWARAEAVKRMRARNIDMSDIELGDTVIDLIGDPRPGTAI